MDKVERWMEAGRANHISIIRFSDCSEENIIFPHCIMAEYAEISGYLYVSEGRPYYWFLERGQAWLLTRVAMRIQRMPDPLEHVVTLLWNRGNVGTTLFHDMELRSESGELLLSCSGSWKVFDLNAFRSLETSEVAGGIVTVINEKADAPECKKIVPEDGLTLLGQRPVVYTDLDCNHHVNNVNYTRIAEDFLPAEYRGRVLDEYYVNFISPAKYGETLEISGQPTEKGYLIQGATGDTLHFRSEFVFK